MNLPKTSLGLAAGLLVVSALAWRLGGDRGVGAFMGYLLGAGLSGLAVAWQAHCLRFRPARAAQAQIEGIAVKLAAVALFALCFRYVEPLASQVSWQFFLLGYAAAAVLVLPLATWDLSKLLAARPRLEPKNSA